MIWNIKQGYSKKGVHGGNIVEEGAVTGNSKQDLYQGMKKRDCNKLEDKIIEEFTMTIRSQRQPDL